MTHTQSRCSAHVGRKDLPRLCHTCQRIAVEYDIAERTIKALFAAQFSVAVNDGEESSDTFHYDPSVGMQKSANRVLAAMFSTDQDFVEVSNRDQEACGWIRFVYGNDGFDVISDYTTNLENVLVPINEYADSLV